VIYGARPGRRAGSRSRIPVACCASAGWYSTEWWPSRWRRTGTRNPHGGRPRCLWYQRIGRWWRRRDAPKSRA